MKKMLFYVTNIILCGLYMNVQLLCYLVGITSYLSGEKQLLSNILTGIIGVILLLNIFFCYRETKK